MIPKINSSHGAETRNLINRAIEVINRLGIDMQTLVANGQLTEEQYAELITIINAMIKSGEVSLNDLDPSVLEAINNGEGTPFEILSIPRDGSVSPTKTDFMKRSVLNLFDGQFLNKVMIYATPPSGDGFYTLDSYQNYDGRLAVIPINPNETYTVSIYNDDFEHLRIGAHSIYPDFSNQIDYKIDHMILNSPDQSVKTYSFSTPENSRYLLIGVSLEGREPLLQVSRGSGDGRYNAPYVLPISHSDPELLNDVSELSQKKQGFLIENHIDGYPPRPEINSVIWVGPNEPTEVEPYDEWRETTGYIYHASPLNFYEGNKKIWSSPNDESLNDTDHGLAYRMDSGSSSTRNALIYDHVPEDMYSADTEIYIKGMLDGRGLSSSPEFGALHRASGIDGSEKGYVIGPQPQSNPTTDLTMVAVTKFYEGTYSRIHQVSSGVDFNQPYHQRSRVDGNRFRAKFWQDGEKEPSSWLIDVEDTSGAEIENGKTGVFFARYTRHLFSLGIGTGGMRAPKRGVVK